MSSKKLVFEKDNLPSGWVRTRIELVCDLVGGGTPSRENLEYFKDGTIIWLTPTEINKVKILKINTSREKITELGLSKSSAKLIPRNAVLLTSRASIGYVAIAGTEVTTNQGFASFLCSKIINNYFLAYWLKGNTRILKSKATGTTFKEIPKSIIKKLYVDVPPLPEQKRIVSKIESIFTQIDAAQKNLEVLASQVKPSSASLNALKNSVLKQAFEVKTDFKMTELGHLILFSKNGFTGRPNENNKGIPRLGIETITCSNSIFINDDKCKFIDISLEKAKNYETKEGDLFFCRQNGNKGNVGKCKVFKSVIKSMIFSDSLIQFRINSEKILPEYLAYFINSLFGRNQIEQYCSTTAGNFSVNGTNLKKILINYPSIPEQKKIIAKIESIFDRIDAICLIHVFVIFVMIYFIQTMMQFSSIEF